MRLFGIGRFSSHIDGSHHVGNASVEDRFAPHDFHFYQAAVLLFVLPEFLCQVMISSFPLNRDDHSYLNVDQSREVFGCHGNEQTRRTPCSETRQEFRRTLPASFPFLPAVRCIALALGAATG